MSRREKDGVQKKEEKRRKTERDKNEDKKEEFLKVWISYGREILFAVNGCIFWFLKLAALIFPLLPVFKDPILSTLCLLFVPEEEELYLLETLVVFYVILCSLSVLWMWNNVAVFQFNVSLPHCNGKSV